MSAPLEIKAPAEIIKYFEGCMCPSSCINCVPYYWKNGFINCRCYGDWTPGIKEADKTVIVNNGVLPLMSHLPTCRAVIYGVLAECSKCSSCPNLSCKLPLDTPCAVEQHIWGADNLCQPRD